MKFCPLCKRLVPKGADSCPSCGKKPQETNRPVSKPDKRRGFVRVPVDEVLRFNPLSLDPQGERLDLKASLKNISLSGVYFEIGDISSLKVLSYLKVSNILWMEFSLPGLGRSIKTQGEIRRIWDISSRDLGLGVMFVNLSQSGYKWINRFISSHLDGKKEV